MDSFSQFEKFGKFEAYKFDLSGVHCILVIKAITRNNNTTQTRIMK